jgi:hypothetical protein
MDKPEFPQSLIIYIKTNIPKHGYITYLPKMSSGSKRHDDVGDAVFFTSRVKLSQECIANYLQTQNDDKNEKSADASPVFFKSSLFKTLTRFCAAKDKATDLTQSLKYYTDAGNVSNNIQVILDTLFKTGNRLYLDLDSDASDASDASSYVIHSSSFSSSAWQMDTKPLYMIPKDMVKTAEKEFQVIQKECPDCVSGKQSTNATGELKQHVAALDAVQPKPAPLLLPTNLPFSEEFAVCDIRTFFYLTETKMPFTSQSIDKYVHAFQELKTAVVKHRSNNEVILTKYKFVFLAMLELLNNFYTKIDASVLVDVPVEKDATQLQKTLKKICRLDISIYEEFARLDFSELLAALLHISPSISSLNRTMLKEGDSTTMLLAMQSFFAFRKCIAVNEYLVQKSQSVTSFDTLLEHKLMAEYCYLLTNVYYFQRRFIHVYLTPLIQEYEKDKLAACTNVKENKEMCLQNTHSKKITTIWMHLFIQSARQNYLTDFCSVSHKPKTLDKKCKTILHLFSAKVLNDNNEKQIKSSFEKITYTSSVSSSAYLTNASSFLHVFRMLLDTGETSLSDGVQLLMHLYMLLHNKICKTSDDLDWHIKPFADPELLAKENNINILILNKSNQMEYTTKRYNDKLGYFVLVRDDESYRLAFNPNQVLFEPNTIHGGKKGKEKGKEQNPRYAESDEGRIREKASLDVKSKIYKPLLLAYYIEISLELFPAQLENAPEQKQSYLCGKQRMEIKNSVQSIKQSIQGLFRSFTSDAKSSSSPSISAEWYFIPSPTYGKKYDKKKDEIEIVQVALNADQHIHNAIADMHQSLDAIHHAINKVNVKLN